MYPVSSSIQKYKPQKDIRRADSSNLATKEKYKLLNTSTPGNQTNDRIQNLSPSNKSSNTRTSLNYQNIIQQLQPSTTKASSKPSSSSSSSKNSYQAKKNDLLKQYLKNTIGTKKSSSKVLPDNWQDNTAPDSKENKENRDISNVKIQLDTTADASYNPMKYQTKVEAYLMNVKSGRPQSANKNPGKTNLINAFLSPKNNPQFQNQLSRNSKGNLVGMKDLNIVNNTTIRYQPDSRDISFVETGVRGKSTEPNALHLDDSRRPSSNNQNNKILLDLDESLHFSPKQQQRPMTVTNSRAKEDFKNILNPNVATTKHGDDRSKKYFKFRDLSNEGFDLEFSPVPKRKDGNTTSDNLNNSAVNIKDSLNRISKNLANQPYPTLIKQINLASNTPTGNAKPPLYNLPLDSQTPSNKPAVSEKRNGEYYPINKALNIQTTKENKKIEFPNYLQNYTYDRTKSKKDISFNLEPYNQDTKKTDQSSKPMNVASSNPNLEIPSQKKSRSSSEHHQDILEVINRRLANESPKIAESNKENTNQLNTQALRYSTGGSNNYNDLLPSKTPKNGSYGEAQLRTILNQTNAYTPSNNIGKQIDSSIKKITDLFTNPNDTTNRNQATSPTPGDKVLTIDIKDYRDYNNKDKENRDSDVLREKNTNENVNPNNGAEVKRPTPVQEEKPDLSNKENIRDVHILDLDSDTRDTKQRQFKEEYLIGKQIGQGAYACVRLAIHKPTNKKIAIKIYDKAKIMEPMRRKSVKREIKLMQRMDHPNIVKIYDTFETGHHVNIIMEYVGGMSLHGYLKSQPNRRLKEENAFKIFKQVVAGINYCHTRCISHRDIKLENILLDHNGNVKLIDFGFSTCIPNDKKVKMFCGTPSYMAPEIVLKKEYAGPPADVWALGVLLFALLCGAFPFKGENDKDLYRRIVKAEFIIPEFVSDNAAALIRRMVTFDCDKRPSAKDIMNDPWYLMHSFLEKKAEQSASSLGSHRKSLSIEKVSTEATDPRSNTSQNLAVINLKPETPVAQVNNFMKPPTSGNTPTSAHTKINFTTFKNEVVSKGGARASSPKNCDGSFLNLTSEYLNNKTMMYNYKDQKGSTNKPENETMIFEDPDDDSKRINAYKKSLNETEIWGNIITQSTEKPYNKRDYSNPRGSSLGNNNIYNLSTNSASKDRHMAPILTGNLTPSNQVSHYDIEIINNMYKMGYKEEEINQGLKDKNSIMFTMYNRLVNEKKATMNSNNMILAALAQNSGNPTSFVSPTHMIMKKRGFDFGNAGYGKNSMLDISGINRDNSMLNTSEYQRNSFNGMRDVNVSNTDIVVKYAGN